MSRRVATITLNPAYDLVGFCPEIERGEVNLVKTTGLHAAGKGINVAKVLKDLGIDVTVGGFSPVKITRTVFSNCSANWASLTAFRWFRAGPAST
ncbi:1-phosphofructokinase [Salmonella enterica subsp. enterica]|uniref:1-phosphofructokinase n=1 Tax=Salmonella enterica I TaxID=59201 RepID=A0A379WQC6_SALET|nr:1-phosphofructokinase [Salmonella enterica subsp. enterica]